MVFTCFHIKIAAMDAAHGIRPLGTCAKNDVRHDGHILQECVLETNRTWAISLLGFAVPLLYIYISGYAY